MAKVVTIKDVNRAKKNAVDALLSIGIDDEILIKIKEFKGGYKDCCGVYRVFTQFHNKPIFWINSKLKDMVKAVELEYNDTINSADLERIYNIQLFRTIIHEYGHVIAEWFRLRGHDMYDYIIDCFSHEENFAEGFADYIDDKIDTAFEPIINRFIEEAFIK